MTRDVANPYAQGLERTAANFTALTPLGFLARAARVYPHRPAVVHGTRRFSWAETYRRSCRLASALTRRGIGRGDTVAVMLANTPEMYEAHFGVPMAGAVLNTLNTRLDAESIAFMLEFALARVLIVDGEFADVARRALAAKPRDMLIVDVTDPEYPGGGSALGTVDYEELLAGGDPQFEWLRPLDEWDPISLNYTSGTTGNPKAVVYHHRGAYLNAICNLLTWGMPPHATYLWTLPMFHCNGWCFPWSIAANAGTNVCLRKVEAGKIFELIRTEGVTHYCGAPIVHTTLVNAPPEMRGGIKQQVHAMVAGAAPPESMIEGMERIGFDLTHVYGLTETYGPAAVCARQSEWDALDLAARAERNGRQGFEYLLQDNMAVLDPETLKPVPADGVTMGEIMFRGNITMKGYLRNPQATDAALKDGWFHSGDLAVVHADGYAKIRDRSKDIIISGGENISSLEVEEALYRHPAVLAAAVVAKPDAKWGETPCAYVELKDGARATADELRAHCEAHLARFKVPKSIEFAALPRTATGKVQKEVLRARARAPQASG